MVKTLKFPKIPEKTCEFIGSIDDLLVQILVHLPLVPLFRFKLVSKHWNSIISDPRFQLMRCQQVHNNNRAVGLFFQTNFSRNFELPPMIETDVVSFNDSRTSNPLPPQNRFLPDKTLGIFHSCNGLLVLKNLDLFARLPEYYVYNPTTNQITPPLLKYDVIKARLQQDRVDGMYLAFDPSKSPHYKVVCVWQLSWKWKSDEDIIQYQFDVYSSETRSWEIRGHIAKGYLDFKNVVYWNGAIHWVSYNDRSVYFNPDDHDGVPHLMPTPPSPLYHHCSYFGESCGHLHCAFVVHDGVNHDDDLIRLASMGIYMARMGIYVYEMTRDYSEWFLKYKVVKDDCSHLFLPNIRNLFCVVRGNKEVDDSFLVLGTDEGEIIRYDLVRNTCETIANDALRFSGYMRKSFQYIESPCSV